MEVEYVIMKTDYVLHTDSSATENYKIPLIAFHQARSVNERMDNFVGHRIAKLHSPSQYDNILTTLKFKFVSIVSLDFCRNTKF